MQEIRDEILKHKTMTRWANLASQWDTRFPGVDAILIKDSAVEDSIKLKTLALQSLLFRHEFTNSIILVSKSKLIVFASKDKLDLLAHLPEQAKHASKEVILIDYKDINNPGYESLFSALASHDFKKFGGFLREKQKGLFIENFEKEFAKRNLTETDVGTPFQELIAIKSEEDLELIGKAAQANVFLMKKFVSEIEGILDANSNTSHQKITKIMENQIESSKRELERSFGIKPRFIEYTYSPVVQSGKNFDLKIDAESNSDPLSQNYILLNMAVKYFELNTNIFRTLLIDPSEEDRRNYGALSKIHEFVVNSLAPGTRCADIYSKTVDLVRTNYPDLIEKLPQNFGFGIGYEFREGCLLLSAKNEKGEIRAGQVFVVVTSLKDLKGRKDQVYAMHLADTVKISENGKINLTAGVSNRLEDIGYTLEDQESEKPRGRDKDRDRAYDRAVAATIPKNLDLTGNGPMASRTRAAKRMEEINREQSKANQLAKHQRQLLDIKMKELEELLASGNFNFKKQDSNKVELERIKAYTPENFPGKNNTRNISVDARRHCVLLPINGQIVPFHVSCLKNVTKHAENKMATLRFNFFTPGTAAGNIVFPSSETYGAHLVYIKELTFRSTNVENYNQIAKEIKDVQKSLKSALSGTADGANERLNLSNKLKFLNDIKMRPAMNGRKTAGTLTAYENGFRFTNKSTNENFDLPLSNVRHAILQTCEQEMLVIIHFALKEKVVISKKEYQHVQFYTEVGLLAEDLNDPRKRGRGHDYDEFEEEELERQARDFYNKQFLDFCGYVEKHWKSPLKFDAPYHDYGFYGSHAYNNVIILPTATCLVSLVEQPFLVVAYEDIEVVSFERVDNKIKNFDIGIVFKDYSRPVQTITNIPKNKLEMLKTWLE